MGYPRITVVTPSYNQAGFLEQTIRSVVDQSYPNLEYIVIDGGSSDESVDIIKRYEQHIDYWVSEKDQGQTDAINKGLRRASGEWVAWQNSDDIYYPGAFHGLAKAANRYPDVDLIIGNMMLIDQSSHQLRDIHYVTPTYKSLLAEGMVLTNQASFWRRSVHAQIGLLDEALHFSFDYEWFLRLLKDRKAAHVNEIWGGYRLHEATKTSNMAERFDEEWQQILEGRAMPAWQKRLYKLRRLALMLGQGEFAYVLRGAWRHARGQGGELY